MTTKRCFKCLCEKPLAEFYRHAAMGDGHLNKCKECTKKDVTAHRQANLERVRQYDRMRASMPHRVAARKEYAQTPRGRDASRRAATRYNNSDHGKANKRSWSQSLVGKASHQEALRRSRARYPERTAARYALGNAIRDGRVIPWPACAVPECSAKPQAHHPNYDAPLDVVWLCPKHHKQAHALVANEPEIREAA